MKCPWNRSLFLDLEFWEWILKTLTPSLQENIRYFTTHSYLTLTKEAMDAEVTLFSKPEELIAWADTFDILLNPSIEDAAILLNYMEGHDYAIGIDSDGKMYRQDVAEENGEIEPYPIDDVIDTVCEWNYELILDADAHRNDPKDFKDYSEFQDKYDSLKADEKRLDRLFEKTCYAKEIDEMAAALVESFISHLSSRDDLEKAAVTVAEGINDYSTGKRGR